MKTATEALVVKVNSTETYPQMFQKEAQGLNLLRKTNSFHIPEIIGLGEIETQAYLLLEYISPGNATKNSWKIFAENLAKQHHFSNLHFGLDENNYIGSLAQDNSGKLENSAEFFIEKRLKPQFKLAAENNFNFSNLEKLYANVTRLIPVEKPSLVHGDLWSGNFLINRKAQPALLDPAVAFSARETDLAMMKLFGGFPAEVFQTYHEVFPLADGFENRVELFQLYYLLVHLNLFGSSYFSAVNRIVEKFST